MCMIFTFSLETLLCIVYADVSRCYTLPTLNIYYNSLLLLYTITRKNVSNIRKYENMSCFKFVVYYFLFYFVFSTLLVPCVSLLPILATLIGCTWSSLVWNVGPSVLDSVCWVSVGLMAYLAFLSWLLFLPGISAAFSCFCVFIPQLK